MDTEKLHQKSKGPFVVYFKTPLSIWKSKAQGWLGLLIAIIFIAIWIIQLVVGSYSSITWFIALINPPTIDTYQIVRQEVESIIKERTKIIQKRDCENSPKFELKFLNSNFQEQQKWIDSCKKYSEAQRDYQMIVYKFENVEKYKTQVRYFEIREMNVEGKIVQQYFEGKLYFERQEDNGWMIANVTRNPIKQSKQEYQDI